MFVIQTSSHLNMAGHCVYQHLACLRANSHKLSGLKIDASFSWDCQICCIYQMFSLICFVSHLVYLAVLVFSSLHTCYPSVIVSSASHSVSALRSSQRCSSRSHSLNWYNRKMKQMPKFFSPSHLFPTHRKPPRNGDGKFPKQKVSLFW